MEVYEFLEDKINKYVSDKNRSFISVGNIKRDYSVPKEMKHFMIEYILTQKKGLYIVPTTKKDLFNLAFDIDNFVKTRESKFILPSRDFFELIINVIIDTINKYFENIPNLSREYITCSHTVSYYKYHIIFPKIKVTNKQGNEIWKLLVTNDSLYKYFTKNDISHIFDESMYIYDTAGLAFPYQEKQPGMGYYRLDQSLSTLDFNNYNLYELMYMSVKKAKY